MRKETKDKGRRILRPVVLLFARLGISPSSVTLAAIPLSLGAAFLFKYGFFPWAGIITGLVGLCDTIDGELSRLTGKTSSAGAILDSTIDRLSEGIIFIGIAWYYLEINHIFVLMTLLASLFSFMVSYVRARSEGVGRDCQVGFFERPVRVVVLMFSAIVLGKRYFPFGVGLIFAGTLFTFVYRLLYVLRPKA
ncbi:MAG: CDP-alcohol phosphatidyltransferase family protein [candidate division WOR-3 bacterium]